MNVISLDEDRVNILNDVVTKRSIYKEVENLELARESLKKMTIVIDEIEYNIKVPEVYNYDGEKIIMERCYGTNAELLLRNYNFHGSSANFINQLLRQFLSEKFYWKDFAPRNILVGDDTISIFDFERGIESKNCSLSNYFIDNVYEEYGAFLLPEERLYQFDDIFANSTDYNISFDDISSKRVKKILNQLGYFEIVPFSKYVLAVKMIILNETPYKKENKIIFPIVELEEFVKENGRDEYVHRIVRNYNEKFRNI